MATRQPLLRRLHRVFGLVAAVWLLLLAVTGSAIAFYDELDTLLNPDWHRVAHDGVSADAADRALEAARAALPGFEPRFVDLPDAPRETLVIVGRFDAGDGHGSVQVFADPRDGRLIGWRDGRASLHRRHLMDTLYGLHTDLMLDAAGVWFIGLVALWWLVDHVVATRLSLPRPGVWRKSLQVRGSAGSLRRLFDLHRAGGLWFLPVSATLALSGLCLAWQDETRALVGLVSPLTQRLHEDFPAVPATQAPIPLERAVAVARSAAGGPVDSIQLLPRAGVYGVRSFDRRDPDDFGRLWTYVSDEGRIVGQRHDVGESGGDAFFAWQYPLHSGRAGGVAGRALVSLAGLVTAALCVTGLRLWWRRQRGASASMQSRTSPGP